MPGPESDDWDAKLTGVVRFVDYVARLDAFARRVEAREFARSRAAP